jgi:signal transduction histidine kinase
MGVVLPSMRVEATGPADLATTHSRFARAAFAIYAGAAAVAISLLVVEVASDRAYEAQQAKERLLLDTEVRADFFTKQLDAMETELRKLGLRSEVNLLDQDMKPEESLLKLFHDLSTFYNAGVAVLDTEGRIAWQPPDFPATGVSFGQDSWFAAVKRRHILAIEPFRPERADEAILFVAAPIMRNREFTGALIGAIDLAKVAAIEPSTRSPKGTLTVIATPSGEVVYPPTPPEFAHEPGWKKLFTRQRWDSALLDAVIGGRDTVIAATTLVDTNFVFMSLADRRALDETGRSRARTRLGVGLALAITPLAMLVFVLARSLRAFRQSEEVAVREERLRMLGEAANLIAHEVKNALNGLGMGVDLVLRKVSTNLDERDERVVNGLRKEVQRLAEFTTELMTFSKGVVPKPVDVDLSEFVPKVTGLARDVATDLGVNIDVKTSGEAIRVRADPTLLHVVVSNLTTNALDAVAGHSAASPPQVKVEVGRDNGFAHVRVSDNGPGVPIQIRSHLFEPFVTGKPNGVGIGLALSRKIARAHGGDLVLETTPAGAAFCFTIPIGAS